MWWTWICIWIWTWTAAVPSSSNWNFMITCSAFLLFIPVPFFQVQKYSRDKMEMEMEMGMNWNETSQIQVENSYSNSNSRPQLLVRPTFIHKQQYKTRDENFTFGFFSSVCWTFKREFWEKWWKHEQVFLDISPISIIILIIILNASEYFLVFSTQKNPKHSGFSHMMITSHKKKVRLQSTIYTKQHDIFWTCILFSFFIVEFNFRGEYSYSSFHNIFNIIGNTHDTYFLQVLVSGWKKLWNFEFEIRASFHSWWFTFRKLFLHVRFRVFNLNVEPQNSQSQNP